MTLRRDNASGMRRRIAILGLAGLLAVNGVLLVVQPGLAVPRGLGNYFFGPKLIRADVVVPVAPDAAVRVNGRHATLGDLKRGMRVVTIRERGGAASEVRAGSR